MAKVVLSEPAKDDLLDIEYYISIELCNPQSAKKIANGILNVIRSLEVYPRRHSYVNNTNLRIRGVRMIRYGNYNIFYHCSNNDVVYVIRILYGQSDWENILK